MDLNIRLDGVEEALKKFSPAVVGKATRMALNEAARGGRKKAADGIYRHWNLKKADINKKLKVKPARASNLTAYLDIASESFSLTYFGAKHYHSRGTTTRWKSTMTKRRRKGRGVRVKIERRGGTTRLPTSFIAAMRSGHIGVFQRTTKRSLPIKERKVITVPSMFKQHDVYVPTLRAITSTWTKRFDHHLTRLMR